LKNSVGQGKKRSSQPVIFCANAGWPGRGCGPVDLRNRAGLARILIQGASTNENTRNLELGNRILKEFGAKLAITLYQGAVSLRKKAQSRKGGYSTLRGERKKGPNGVQNKMNTRKRAGQHFFPS